MARHDFRESVLIILTLLIGVGILLLIGSQLIHIALRRPIGTTGIFAVSGGISALVVSVLIAMLAILVVVAGLRWRR